MLQKNSVSPHHLITTNTVLHHTTTNTAPHHHSASPHNHQYSASPHHHQHSNPTHHYQHSASPHHNQHSASPHHTTPHHHHLTTVGILATLSICSLLEASSSADIPPPVDTFMASCSRANICVLTEAEATPTALARPSQPSHASFRACEGLCWPARLARHCVSRLALPHTVFRDCNVT